MMSDCENRYSPIEKTCCAVAWLAQRLRHYLQSHTIWLISKMDPIKYIFEKPYLSGRIARWQALLSQYDIIYDGGYTPGPTKGMTAGKESDQSTNQYAAPDLYRSPPRNLDRRPRPIDPLWSSALITWQAEIWER
jgi:hypothetical protein